MTTLRTVVLLTLLLLTTRALAAEPVTVLVWDEQQPAQKQAYDNFLGNAIADYLRTCDGLHVRSVRLDDPETFSVYLQKEPLRVIENAVRWLGRAE